MTIAELIGPERTARIRAALLSRYLKYADQYEEAHLRPGGDTQLAYHEYTAEAREGMELLQDIAEGLLGLAPFPSDDECVEHRLPRKKAPAPSYGLWWVT